MFAYENIIMCGNFDEEKAGAILCHLEGAAFDYFYDTYNHNGNLTEVSSGWGIVKRPWPTVYS